MKWTSWLSTTRGQSTSTNFSILVWTMSRWIVRSGSVSPGLESTSKGNYLTMANICFSLHNRLVPREWAPVYFWRGLLELQQSLEVLRWQEDVWSHDEGLGELCQIWVSAMSSGFIWDSRVWVNLNGKLKPRGESRSKWELTVPIYMYIQYRYAMCCLSLSLWILPFWRLTRFSWEDDKRNGNEIWIWLPMTGTEPDQEVLTFLSDGLSPLTLYFLLLHIHTPYP
jgi:hypothetical protein